jgi:hypothetical protein
MRYDDVMLQLRQTPSWGNEIKRTDRDCERTELLKLLKRQELLETQVGCINRRNLDNTKLADAWTKKWLGNGLNLMQVAQTSILMLAKMKNEDAQAKAIEMLKLVIKKDTNPRTFMQLGVFGVTEHVMKYIIQLSIDKVNAKGPTIAGYQQKATA